MSYGIDYNHSHNSLSSARTFVDQNWCWWFSLALRNIETEIFTCMASESREENIHKLHLHKLSIWQVGLNKANVFRGVAPVNWMLICFDSFWIQAKHWIMFVMKGNRRKINWGSYWKTNDINNETQHDSITNRKMSYENCKILIL